jgi:hypothetical protein
MTGIKRHKCFREIFVLGKAVLGAYPIIAGHMIIVIMSFTKRRGTVVKTAAGPQ